LSISLLTLGCRLNTAESEAMRARAEEAGFGQDNSGPEGRRDIIIVNTCAVTEEAVRQARKAIRRASRENPAARIVVTGCAAQIEPGSFAAMEEVSLVLGNAEKTDGETWRRLKSSNSFGLAGTPADKLLITDIMAARAVAPHMAGAFREHTRAFLQVQNGCDHRCTFCVIPFGRGPSRSRAMGEVVDEVKRLVDQGVKEIVLTGVDLTSFGGDLPGAPKLGDLVRMILRHAPDLPRLRLSSIDAIELDDRLKDAIAGEKRLMPHLHLSLQHGDDIMLKRMKRRHGRDNAIGLCAELRALRPDITFGADLIAGFPTEDEAAFTRSIELIGECGLAFTHVFPYSPRPGTPAARMPQLPRELVRERAARIREAGEAAHQACLSALAGSSQTILTERGNTGHTEGFAPVTFSQPVAPGKLVTARITGHDGKRLTASLGPASPERELAGRAPAPMLPA
jgi:threonylcarbamoyladenosine tRNA methylthiotransferase MtaB